MIYILSKYSGWYSVSDEAFYNDDEIEEDKGKKFLNLQNHQLNGWMKNLIFLDCQNGKNLY